MAISPYFHHQTSGNEQNLMQSLTTECIYLKGLDFLYIPRDSEDADWLFGEDISATFTKAVKVEMYPEEQTGFGGDGDFMSRMGLDIRDEATFVVAKNRFLDTVTKQYKHITRPREGDLIAYLHPQIIFEITFCEHEKPFYQRGIQTIWEMTTKRFEYNQDDMSSGISEIDEIENIEPFSDSDNIQDESDEFVNFDENDPFSDNNY